MADEWGGIRGEGPRQYTEAQYRRVVSLLNEGGVMRLEVICTRAGVLGRTLRSILSDADGIEFVLLGHSDGAVSVAESRDEVERTTRRLERQAERMLERVSRRRAFGGRLPQIQQVMAL